jgi:non-homologous end joining protein Ku
VHDQDSSPIRYQKTCKAENTPVPDDEIVKAFEYRNCEIRLLDR